MPTGEAVVASTAVTARNEPRPAGLRPAQLLVWAAPALVTLAVTLWGITSSSYWRDEAATMVAVHRSFGQVLQLLSHVDAVHGAYYLMMWVVVRIGGTGELVTRFPSAVAMAVGAAMVAAIGKRVVSPLAGLAGGLVFALVPSTSLYAQNARPDAFAVALAAVATYLLIRVLEDGAASRRWLAWYAASVAALGLMDILALLLIAAHAVTVVVAAFREKDRSARRALALRWLLAAVAAIIVVSPLAWLAYSQRAAVSWIQPLDARQLRALVDVVAPVLRHHTARKYSLYLSLALLAALAAGLLVSALAGRASMRKRWPSDLAAVCLPWLILPVVIMMGISLVKPIYNVRYIQFCFPALAVLSGAALASLGRIAGAAALVVLALLGVPAQAAARAPNGHGEDIRGADQVVAGSMHPGDAVIFHNRSEESWSFAYSYGFAELRDINQAQTPAASGTLTGTLLPASAVQQRLSQVSRVWVADLKYPLGRTAPRLTDKYFRIAGRWRIDDIVLFLYIRRGGT